jgi:hypothetical protein
MPKPKALSVFLVEQDVANLTGEYLTECVAAAPSSAAAKRAAASLSDPVAGFGLVVLPGRLSVTELGPLTTALPRSRARHLYGRTLLLAVGTGTDEDRV